MLARIGETSTLMARMRRPLVAAVDRAYAALKRKSSEGDERGAAGQGERGHDTLLRPRFAAQFTGIVYI